MGTGSGDGKDGSAHNELKSFSRGKGFAASLLILGVFFLVFHSGAPKVAYVSTGKLMIGFSEANVIDKELKVEDDAWRAQLKSLEDSLHGQMDKMSKDYNKASTAQKKEMQDMLSARNQQMNNFRQANMQKMEEEREKKMQSVFDKVNVFLKEYREEARVFDHLRHRVGREHRVRRRSAV